MFRRLYHMVWMFFNTIQLKRQQRELDSLRDKFLKEYD